MAKQNSTEQVKERKARAKRRQGKASQAKPEHVKTRQ